MLGYNWICLKRPISDWKYYTEQPEKMKPTFPAFCQSEKKNLKLYSQLCDQFMIIRNYAKDIDGLFNLDCPGRLAHPQSCNILTIKNETYW